MRIPLIRACGLLLVLAASCAAGVAQTSSDTLYHLHGTVVNAVTGRAIGRALVLSADRRLATMTNSEGQFALTVSVPASQAALQAGSSAGGDSISSVGRGVMQGGGMGSVSPADVMLMAQRPGYLPSRSFVNVSLDNTADSRTLTLRLTPSASVRGRVVASGAEGLRGLRVQLLRHSVQDGRLAWQFAGSHPVGEDGTFHFIDLQPGEYTVATAEWAPGGFNPVAAVSQQYPPDFLGDTATLDAATKLHLSAGQAVPAALHLRAAAYYSVSIPVQGMQANAGANVRVISSAGVPLYQLSWNARNSTVEGALPDGDYLIDVTQFGVQRASARVPLHVAGAPVAHAPVGMTPLQDIPVSVRDERTGTDSTGGVPNTIVINGAPAAASPGFFLTARGEDVGTGMSGMETSASGPALRNMAPGRYYVQGSATRGYLASVTCDGVDLLTGALVVNDSGNTAPIQVTLRDDGGTISATVDLAAAGLQAARILILPTDGSGHVLFGYAMGAGNFQISNVPPGSYRVLAIPADQPDTLPYRDPQAMRTFNSRGGTVTVMAGQTAQVRAELVNVDGADTE